MIVHLIDGTYELFRLYYGQKRFHKGPPRPYGAVVSVLHSVLELIEGGATHIGVATDHVVESFRNELWAGYKTGEGIEPALARQFHPLEDALVAMGVVNWPMVEFEADDALASAAHRAAKDRRVTQVQIWANDKDLAQCVRGRRVVQVDRRAKQTRDATGVKRKFGVVPERIPDYLALVGDASDGYPGVAKIGAMTAVKLIARHGAIEKFPKDVLGAACAQALLFKKLATLRTDAKVFRRVDELRWAGATKAFAAMVERMAAPRLLERCAKAERKLGLGSASPSARRARARS